MKIGFSGYVYKGGRKGEDLALRLATDERFSNYEFVASGRDWPKPIKTYSLEVSELPSFFSSLDVYICTANIEGIGYPVLEALACGTPVVIPIGVGVFDELPQIKNIYRYVNNDYKSLSDTLLTCLSDIDSNQIDKQSLINAVKPFTVKAWNKDHLSAFENLLYKSPEVSKGKGLTKGIYYVAFGKQALDCVEKAIKSAKQYLDLPICLVTSEPIELGQDITVIQDDKDIGGRIAKISIDVLAPNWDLVLYLDADTEIVSSDVEYLFMILENGWDMVICTNPHQYALVKDMERPDNKAEITETIQLLGDGDLLQVNGGVFAYRRNARTQQFFEDWLREWMKYGKRDQAAWDRVFYTNPVMLYVLGNEWNTITRYINPEKTAGILHYPMTARRWRGKIEGRLDSDEAWGSIHPEYKK